MTPRIFFPVFIFLLAIQQISTTEEGYLRYMKDNCFIKGEALSCVKYKALKIAKNTIFGDNFYANETIKANNIISFVPLDEKTINQLKVKEDTEVMTDEARGIISEWTQLAKYFMKLMKDFFRLKGIRVELPEGARTIESEDVDDALPRPASPAFFPKRPARKSRGRRKKLAMIIPLLTLLASLKTKMLLVPILLSVLLIKKLLLIAALLLPSLLSTLKHCKYRGGGFFFGNNESSDFSSDYNNYAYSTGYSKDWALNRAYSMPKHRPTPSPMYATAPGAAI